MRDKPQEFDGDIPWIRIEDFNGKYISGSKSDQKVSETTVADMNLKVFPVGTVLCSCSCSMGATAIVSQPLISNQTFIGIVPAEDLFSDFLYYLVQAAKPTLDSLGTGAIQKYLSRSDFEHFKVAFPSLSEQQAIADFLDRKTAQIDTLIEKKQRQIDLLQEQRDVMTQNAMRSSEVKSLKLGDVADWIKRPINRQDEELYERIGLYNRGRGIFHKPIAKGVDLGDSDFFEIKDGDFVISGQFAWEGAVALARQEEDGCFASHRYYSLRGKPGYAETAYLFSFFTTQLGDNLLNHHSRGAAGRNRPLNINTLLREKIPVPPLSMQIPITDLIEKTVVLKKNTQKLVDFLQEYRATLISDVVTGKIDVRTAV